MSTDDYRSITIGESPIYILTSIWVDTDQMLDVFEKAAHFTMDDKLRDTLLNCSMGVFPKQFTVSNGMITTMSGEQHTIPADPMDVTNLVHDILISKPRRKNNAAVPPPSTRTRGSKFSMDELRVFSMREATRLGKDEDHGRRLWGLIYSCIFLNILQPTDIRYKESKVVSIDRIDTERCEYMERE